jgi:glycosyltransferase 2 family protein
MAETEPQPAAPRQDRRASSLARMLPGLLISAASLAIVLYLAKPQRLVAALRQADLWLAIGGGVFTLLWLLVRGMAWRILLQDKVTFSQTFFTLNEGYLLNNFLPFRLGEVGRAYLLGEKSKLGFWRVLSSILIERALDVLLMAVLLLGTLPFVTGITSARGAALGVGGVFLVAMLGLYAIARYPQQFMRLFDRLTARIGFLSRLGKQVLPNFFSGLAVLTEPGRFLRAGAWFLLNILVAITSYTVFLYAFFPNANPLWAVFCLAVSSLGIALPSSPGSLGVFEGAVVGALAVFKLDAGTALAFAFTMHFWNYAITGILGSYALARDGESIFHLYDQVRRVRKSEAQN